MHVGDVAIIGYGNEDRLRWTRGKAILNADDDDGVVEARPGPWRQAHQVREVAFHLAPIPRRRWAGELFPFPLLPLVARTDENLKSNSEDPSPPGRLIGQPRPLSSNTKPLREPRAIQPVNPASGSNH